MTRAAARASAIAPASGTWGERLARGSMVALVLYGCSAFLSYFAQLATARTVGAAAFGVYAYVLAWVTVLAYACALGFDVSLLRFLPAYRARHSWGLMRGVAQYADRMIGLAAFLLLVSTVPALLILGLGSPEFTRTSLAGLLLVPVLAWTWVRCSASRAFGGIVLALAPDRLVRDGLLLLLVVALGPGLGWHLGAPQAMDATLLAGAVGLALASVGRRHLAPRAFAEATPQQDARSWMRAAGPLVALGAIEAAMNRSGVVLLGWNGAVTEAGVYAVIFNVALLVTLPRTAANALFAPAISDLFVRNERGALQAMMARTMLWTFLGAVAIASPLFVLAHPILSLFGHSFESGVAAARILLVGQVAAAAIGSQLIIMTMTGCERAAAIMLAAIAAASALLGAALIPSCGLIGAAIGAASGLVGLNLATGIFVRRRFGLRLGVLAALRVPVP